MKPYYVLMKKFLLIIGALFTGAVSLMALTPGLVEAGQKFN